MKYFLLFVLSAINFAVFANGTCANPILLNCGDVVINQNTANGINNYNEHGGGNPNYTGPELVYEFEAAAGNVTINMTNLSIDLDLYLLDVCTDPVAGEIGFSENGGTLDETINLNLTSGGTFYIMVDGFNGNSGTFDLSLSCTTLNINCPTNQAVNGNPIGSGTYRAGNSLTSTGRVANSSNVAFRAGQNITLQPGFRVENGATFTARIQACPTSRQEDIPNLRSARVVQKTTVQIYPNPVVEQATILIILPKKAEVEIILLDAWGREVKTLLSAQYQAVGSRKYLLDSDGLAAGWYIVGSRIDEDWQYEKIILVK